MLIRSSPSVHAVKIMQLCSTNDKDAETKIFEPRLQTEMTYKCIRCHRDQPTAVRRHRIWFSLENVAQQDFTFGYNRVRVRAKSAALRLGRGSARVAHQGGHWPSCVENSSNNLLQMCQQTVCRDRTDGKMGPMRAGAVNTTKTVIFFSCRVWNPTIIKRKFAREQNWFHML